MAGLALYVHWPFCVSKCPYCDFNSHIRDAVDQAAWRSALLADLGHEARATAPSKLSSIFFGGGTPSLMPPETVAAIIASAAEQWGFEPDIEITLEANPSSVEAARFADLGAAGINRISLGIQSLNDDTLQFLGRAHDVAEGLAALDIARKVFARVSFDLIYAVPGQSVSAWQDELGRALAMETGHLSLYQLTIEPGTQFAARAGRGEQLAAEPNLGAALYEATQELCNAAGLPAYEISNHARPGEESRHNLSYWRYQSYAGIGPGAHGRRNGQATIRHRKPENWLAAVGRNDHGLQLEEQVPVADQALEALLMGLRLSEGIELANLPADILDQGAIDQLTGQGFFVPHADRLIASPGGRLVLNRLLEEITVSSEKQI